MKNTSLITVFSFVFVIIAIFSVTLFISTQMIVRPNGDSMPTPFNIKSEGDPIPTPFGTKPSGDPIPTPFAPKPP